MYFSLGKLIKWRLESSTNIMSPRTIWSSKWTQKRLTIAPNKTVFKPIRSNQIASSFTTTIHRPYLFIFSFPCFFERTPPIPWIICMLSHSNFYFILFTLFILSRPILFWGHQRLIISSLLFSNTFFLFSFCLVLFWVDKKGGKTRLIKLATHN